MKILFLSSYVDLSSGASILVRLANRLKQKGHDVKVLTTNHCYKSEIIESVRLPIGVELINIAFNAIVPNYFSIYYFPLLAAIQKYDPDVINIHWTHGCTIPIQLIPKLNRKWPVFWTIHDLWPITLNTFFEYTGGETLLKQPATIIHGLKLRLRFTPSVLFRYKIHVLNRTSIHTISPSKWLQEKVNESPVFRTAKNHHTPNGVDTNVFKPIEREHLRKKYGVPEDDKVILFLSANLADKRKGFYYFAKALEQLKATDPDLVDNVTILLVGGNSEGANKYLPTRVQNLGRTQDASQLAEYFNLSDVFVSASIADNFPSTSLESVACGTPVVAFDVGGVSEIVIDHETGLLVKSKDIHDLANNIREMLTNKSLHQTLSSNCREYAIKHFSMDKFANNYLKLFKQAVDEFSSRV